MSTRFEKKDKFVAREMAIERLEMAMDVAVDGIWDWQIEKDEVCFDPRYYVMAGYAPNEFPASFQEWENRVHAEDLPKVKPALEAYLNGDSQLFLAQFRYRTKEGDWIWIRGRGKIVARDAAGNPTRMIGTHTDITELKEAELVRRKSEENYRLFIENAHDCIFITQDGVMKYANASTERILGYSRTELAAIPFIEIIHPDDRQMVLSRHKSRLAGDETPTYYSFRGITKVGAEHRFELNAIRIDWEDKPAVLCFVKDITEMRKMEQQLLRSQKMQAIGTLAGGIATTLTIFCQP